MYDELLKYLFAGAIATGIWLIRLEGKVLAASKETAMAALAIRALETSQNALAIRMVEELGKIRESLVRIEASHNRI